MKEIRRALGCLCLVWLSKNLICNKVFCFTEVLTLFLCQKALQCSFWQKSQNFQFFAEVKFCCDNVGNFHVVFDRVPRYFWLMLFQFFFRKSSRIFLALLLHLSYLRRKVLYHILLRTFVSNHNPLFLGFVHALSLSCKNLQSSVKRPCWSSKFQKVKNLEEVVRIAPLLKIPID